MAMIVALAVSLTFTSNPPSTRVAFCGPMMRIRSYGRVRNHGPRTEVGREKIAACQRERWEGARTSVRSDLASLHHGLQCAEVAKIGG